MTEDELARCTQDKEDLQAELAVLQESTPPSIQIAALEDSNGVDAPPEWKSLERIQELERELNKKEDLLVCKTAALNSAIDGKTMALQLAAEWEVCSCISTSTQRRFRRNGRKQMRLRWIKAKPQEVQIQHERNEALKASIQVLRAKLVGVCFVVQKSQKTQNLTQSKRSCPVLSFHRVKSLF